MSSSRIRIIGLLALATAALAGPLAGVAHAAVANNTGLPLISGTAQVGQTLSYTAGTWDDNTATVVDQWWSCPTASTCAQITGTTDNQAKYTVQSADVGATIEIQETATNATGPATATSQPTAAVTPAPAAPNNTNAPTISSGTPQVGQKLTYTKGTWDDTAATIVDQWWSCPSATTCGELPGTTDNQANYTVKSTDIGATIEIHEVATNTGGSTTAFSPPTASVTAVAPTNKTVPKISGTAQVGQVLMHTEGTWDDTTAAVVDQWWSCPTATTCGEIPGTTDNQPNYTVQSTDVAATIEIHEVATNTGGSTTAYSTATAKVIALAPTITTPPAISGTAQVNQTLTHTSGVWSDATAVVVDQWWSCPTATTCAEIAGTTDNQANYTVKSTDIGATIEIHEVATNTGGSTTAYSAATPAVIPLPPGFVAAPTISGTAQAGQVLTEGPAKWSSATPITSTMVQWYRCDSSNLNCLLVGAGKTYTLTDTDVGATIQVAETAANAGGSTTNYSGFSNPVVNAQQVVPPPVVTSGSTPAIAGSAQLGRTLMGSGAQFKNNPGTFSYQWLRCNPLGCVAIPGETDVTYTPTSADVGDSIALSETASNSGGTSATVQSPRTDTITAPSTTTLQSNSSAPFAGQTVTLIATVTSAAGSVKPAGTVEFRDGGTPVPGCVGLPLGTSAPTAVCQASFPASVANVSAAYTAAPGTFITGSTSSPTTLIVGRGVTSVTVAASAHVSLGAKTTYTATVHPPGGSSLTPTGRVTFTDSGKTIKGCGGKALAAHKAGCSVKYLGLKQHRISARYSGDANFAPSASITSHVLVQPQAPNGFVAVFMSWSFKFALHATRIAQLDATGLSAGIHITVTCSGGGCPFATRAMTVSAHGKCGKPAKSGCVAAPSFDLASIFHRARLHVGTRVAVAVTHRGWVGKYYRFTIRKGRKPAIDVSCLAVNGTRPGVGCSAR